MGEYQRKRGKYILPSAVYWKTIYQIRDYHRLSEKIKDMIDESPNPRQLHVTGGKKNSEVESKFMRIYDDSTTVALIEKARDEIPEEYRSGVWRSVMYKEPYPIDASRSTYGMYKSRFVYTVALYLGFI